MTGSEFNLLPSREKWVDASEDSIKSDNFAEIGMGKRISQRQCGSSGHWMKREKKHSRPQKETPNRSKRYKTELCLAALTSGPDRALEVHCQSRS